MRHKARSSDLTWRQLDDQVVLLDLRTSTYLTIAGAGTVIWVALQEARTLDELTTVLTDEFDIDDATARLDAEAFLGELAARGLLQD